MSINLSLAQGGSFCLNSAGVAAGTTAGTVKTTNALTYVVDGLIYSKAATDNVAFAVSIPATYGVAGNGAFTGDVNGGTTKLFGVYLDKAGAFSFLPGSGVRSAELAAGSACLDFPPAVKDRAFIGAVRIAAAAGVTFIPGTTALNAAGITASYIAGAFSIPAEPIRS